jgi:hypothetical protein
MDDIQAKLDTIEERHSQLLAKTPADHHKEKVAEAYETLLAARSDLDQTPYRVKNAEKQYYIAKYGPDGYKDHLKSSAQKQALSMKGKFMAAHTALMSEVNHLLIQFEGMRGYVSTISDTEDIQCENINRIMRQIHQEDAQTNLRRMYFMNLKESTLNVWIQRLNIFLAAFAVQYAVSNRQTLSHPSTYALPATLICIVFGYSYLVQYAFQIPTAVNSYTNWGYDPSESKLWWYIFIPVGMAVLWALILYFEPGPKV